mgnify:CR=1 FL=1
MKGFIDSTLTYLEETLLDVPGLDEVVIFSDVEEIAAKAEDFIITSIDFIDIREVTLLRSRFPNSKIFYIVSVFEDSSEANAVQSVCKAHQIKIIPPGRTVHQIANEVQSTFVLKTRVDNRVAAMISAKYDVGATSALLILGKQIAELTGKEVGVIGLNGSNPGISQIEYKGKFLDEIWGSIDGKQLKPDDLPNKMHELAPNLYYLAGNRDLLKIYNYTPEGIEHLINLAKTRFEIVFLDLGYFADTPLAAQGLVKSDIIMLCTNQRQSAKEDWARMKSQIIQRWIGLEMEKTQNVWLVCNQMHDNPELETATQLSRQYNLVTMASLPYLDKFSKFETQQNLLQLNDKRYLQELRRLSDGFIQYYKMPLVESELAKRKTFWRKS